MWAQVEHGVVGDFARQLELITQTHPPDRPVLRRIRPDQAGALPAKPCTNPVANHVAAGVVVDLFGQGAQHGVLELLAW